MSSTRPRFSEDNLNQYSIPRAGSCTRTTFATCVACGAIAYNSEQLLPNTSFAPAGRPAVPAGRRPSGRPARKHWRRALLVIQTDARELIDEPFMRATDDRVKTISIGQAATRAAERTCSLRVNAWSAGTLEQCGHAANCEGKSKAKES